MPFCMDVCVRACVCIVRTVHQPLPAAWRLRLEFQ